MSSPTFKIFSDEDEVADTITSLAIADILRNLSEKPIFHLALTGGGLGNLVNLGLSREFNLLPSRFAGLHIWWGDERFLSYTSRERNDFVLREYMEKNSAIHLHPVLSPEDVDDVETSAKRYNADLAGINIDLGIFGIGLDGHIASLFPPQFSTESSLDETRSVIAVRSSPKPPAERVTFSMPKINSIDRLWLIATGEGKRQVVEEMSKGNMELPVCHAKGVTETVIFVDYSCAPSL